MLPNHPLSSYFEEFEYKICEAEAMPAFPLERERDAECPFFMNDASVPNIS